MFVELDGLMHEVYSYDDEVGCGITYCGRFAGPWAVELGPPATCSECLSIAEQAKTLSREEVFGKVKAAAAGHVPHTVTCKACGRQATAAIAHRHQGAYIGECCWDERLRSSE